MKQFALIAAALLMALTGCNNKTDEQKIADYQTGMQTLEQTYTEEINKIDQDSTLTAEQKTEAMRAYDEKFTDDLVADAIKLIKKNASSPLAVNVLKDVYYQMDVDQLEKALSYIKGDNLQNDFVIATKAGLDSKKLTAEGKMFTDFTIVQDEADPAASTVKFSDYVGKCKYVLVDFWASWCGPCKREIPNLAAVYDKYKGDDFDVLSVAVWDKPEATKAAAIEHGIIWSQIINAQKIPTDIYGIDGIPHIMLVGPDGIIIKRDLRGADIEKAVSQALGR